jgi:hypothetical protein
MLPKLTTEVIVKPSKLCYCFLSGLVTETRGRKAGNNVQENESRVGVSQADSGSSDRKVVWVQVPSSAPKETPSWTVFLF